jgi:superfamily I DNA and RNA helicase
MNKLLELLASDIEQIIHSWKELNKNFRSQNLEFNKHSVLIQCFTKDSVNEVSNYLTQRFSSKIVRRKSGDDIWTGKKRSNLAVEISCINIALVQDAKGYDADVVFVINPDECGGSSYDKRAKFYVASTRAKQFLAIYNSLSISSSPIAQDALDAFVYMNSEAF